MLGLFTRCFNAHALLLGWVAGITTGTYMAATRGFVSSIYPLEIFGFTLPGYAALYSVVVNVLVATALNLFFNRLSERGRVSSAQ